MTQGGRLSVEIGPIETRILLEEQQGLRRIWAEPVRALAPGERPGDLVLGRVTAVSRELAGAFVDIGAARPGFLPRTAVPSDASGWAGLPPPRL
ncbi:MAG: S1 RNA-binding domain-containing protein, partial [Alphaproteobacteria bacterium]|nr:S1 RNA-binding domain-containing protein [Alphaproteobacteria bacterium]